MANTCFIRILAVCPTSAHAAELTAKLNRLAAAAAARQEGFDADGLYIFDAEVSKFTRGVVLDGWVKWGIDDPHALALVGFLENQTALKAAFIECCTPDSKFFSEITWADGKLTARELPCEWWPEDWQYGDDVTPISNVLSVFGVEHEIKAEEEK